MIRITALFFVNLVFTCTAFGQVAGNICDEASRNNMIVPTKNGAFEVSSISVEEAYEAFEEVLKTKHKVPYYTANTRVGNCVYRAYRISEVLYKEMGINTLKSFVHAKYETDSSGNEIYDVSGERFMLSGVSYSHPILGFNYSWDYHTAPVVCVRNRGKHELYSLDPSLYDKPVPHSKWRSDLTGGQSLRKIGKNYLVNMFHLSPTPEGTRNLSTKFTRQASREAQKVLKREDWKFHKAVMKQLR